MKNFANLPIIANLKILIKTTEAVITFFEWTRDNVAWRIEKIVGARRLLERKPMCGICTDKASLFIALCRAANLPARYVILDCELEAKKEELKRLSHHTAAEVFVGGKWLIVDPTFGKSTQALVPLSQFGREPWTKAKNEKKGEGFITFHCLGSKSFYNNFSLI